MRTFLGAFTVALGIFIFTVLFGMGNGLKTTFKQFDPGAKMMEVSVGEEMAEFSMNISF